MTKENNNGLYWMIAAFISMCIIIFFADSKFEEKYKNRQPQTHCSSKVSGGRPSCWTDADWVEYCSRTTICK